MFVRVLVGVYAGQERDIRADQAQIMLADGRAERIGAPSTPQASISSPKTPLSPAKKKKADR